MNKKILALIVISNLSVYSVFSQSISQNLNINPTEISCPTLKFYLSRGTTDSKTNGEVSLMQRFLKTNLKLSNKQFLVTGSFGKVTENFVKVFQQTNGLIPTGIVGVASRKKITTLCNSQKPTLNPVPTPIPVDPIKKTTLKYKDGIYNVTTSYGSPGGLDNLGVSLSILNDKVSTINVTNGATDGTSQYFQDGFIKSIKSGDSSSCPQIGIRYSSGAENLNSNTITDSIVGKSLNNLTIRVVCGASLTSASFNEALQKIRLQAQN